MNRVDAMTVAAGVLLAIARWIVDVHRGSIVVQSRLGAGSEFRVTLPFERASVS